MAELSKEARDALARTNPRAGVTVTHISTKTKNELRKAGLLLGAGEKLSFTGAREAMKEIMKEVR